MARFPIYRLPKPSKLESGSKAKMEGSRLKTYATTAPSAHHHQRLDHKRAKSRALPAYSDSEHDGQ
jgi:hypothetical protein